MRAATLFPAEILEPLPGDSPSGVDLRFSPEWKAIEESKREDDGLDKGAWATKDQKSANWSSVGDQARQLLTRQSKDIRLAMFLVEAAIREDGFAAVPESLRFLQDFVTKFWNLGLYPEPDGGSLDDRAAAFDWINEKLPDLLAARDLTYANSGRNFTYSEYVDARSVGREKDYEEGKVSEEKRERFLKAKQEGRVLDFYYAAVSATKRDEYEKLAQYLDASLSALKSLHQTLHGLFGSAEAAPGFTNARKALEDISAHLDSILEDKRREEPTSILIAGSQKSGGGVVSRGFPAFGFSQSANAGDWEKAENMIRSGQVESGLAEMTVLAQRETSGRTRFQRKLLLAQIAMQISRDRLAQSILEELAEQIESFKLVEWETTDIVGSVWKNLYELHKRGGNSDRAQQLYQRLCRLDPWQALSCAEE